MLRGAKPLVISSWRGHNTFEHKEEIAPDFWMESNNVIVNSSGHAEALRSPKTFKADITEFGDLSASGTTYRDAVLADVPEVYWRLDEVAGATAVDSSGNGNDGTHANTPTLNVAGALVETNAAVTYNGTNEYTYVNGASDFDDVFTLEAWIKLTAIGSISTIWSGSGTNQPTFFVAANGRITLAKIGVDGIAQATAAITAGVWTHAVATKNGSSVHLYKNGVDVTGVVSNQTIVTGGADDMYLAAASGAAADFAGSIDEAAIYSRALSAERVLFHYERGSGADLDTGEIHGLESFVDAGFNGLIVDKGDDTFYLNCTDGVYYSIVNLRSGQASDPFNSLQVSKTNGYPALLRCDGNEFMQYVGSPYVPGLNYAVGITPPSAAPTLSFTAGANAGTIAVGVKVSFSYYNSTTGHASAPSPISASSGPKGANFNLKIDWNESTQYGVDQVIFFITTDGGEVPFCYLYDESIGNPDVVGTPVVETDASETHSIAIDKLVNLDTLTPEPIYNRIPPTNATFLFGWKERVWLVVDGKLRYSASEVCYVGQPTESYPVLNELSLLNDKAVGGIGTQVGALVFGKNDCHLISGSPSDKTAGPQNTNAVSEKVTPLEWNFGIKDPKTAAKSPFGIIWVDSTSKLRLWNLIGYPQEITEQLRSELFTMGGTLRGKWFDHGETAGTYVLSNGTKTLFVTLFQVDGKLQVGCGKSDTVTGPIAVGKFAESTANGGNLLPSDQFFFARGNDIYEWLDPDLTGDGWPADTDISFALVAGNDLNFSKLHSLQVTGETDEISVIASDVNRTVEEDVVLESDVDTDNSKFAIVDTEWRRHRLTFEFAPSDTYKSVDTLRLILKPKKRTL
jgi:hypothetical protein